jgi:hypothetical protein
MQFWTFSPLPFVPALQVTSEVAPPGRVGVSVTKDEIFSVPDGVVPMMMNTAAVLPSAGIAVEVGLIVIEDTFSATVAVVVPVTDPEAAVMVDVPTATPVSRPPTLIVATVGSELDQHTVEPVQLVPPFKVALLPSLLVAAAVNCSGDDPGPNPTAGFGGSIVIVETVGFWKNPVQPIEIAKMASAAKAPIRRSLCFVDDMII